MAKPDKPKDPDVTADQDQESDPIGYRNPPKHTRFKPGQSGNPAGRPKGVRNFSTEVQKALNMSVDIIVNGKPRRMTTQQAVMMRLREKALKGEDRGLDKLLTLALLHNTPSLPVETGAQSTDDAAILADFEGDIARRALASRPASSTRRARKGRRGDD